MSTRFALNCKAVLPPWSAAGLRSHYLPVLSPKSGVRFASTSSYRAPISIECSVNASSQSHDPHGNSKDVDARQRYIWTKVPCEDIPAKAVPDIVHINTRDISSIMEAQSLRHRTQKLEDDIRQSKQRIVIHNSMRPEADSKGDLDAGDRIDESSQDNRDREAGSKLEADGKLDKEIKSGREASWTKGEVLAWTSRFEYYSQK